LDRVSSKANFLLQIQWLHLSTLEKIQAAIGFALGMEGKDLSQGVHYSQRF
jgi:hypothetical protein